MSLFLFLSLNTGMFLLLFIPIVITVFGAFLGIRICSTGFAPVVICFFFLSWLVLVFVVLYTFGNNNSFL